ncbi:MAG TPA: TRAP transporter substrate-binding protein [Burkholderiales bacterium]
MTTRIVMGGYGPPTTSHSRGLQAIGDRLQAEFGNAVDIKYVWNILDFGYQGGDLLWMTEQGILTLTYQSTSYLTDKVPELEFADLPFLFRDLAHARSVMDGALGAYLSRKIEERYAFRVLGYFENGYRHLTNRLRPVRTPADLAGMRIRLMPSQMHARTFAALGAVPVPCDLKEGLEMVRTGAVDAQENPFANTVTYGCHKVHRHVTLTNHCYMSRGLYLSRAQFERWPERLRAAMQRAAREAIALQREYAVAEEETARKALEAEGCEFVELTADQRAAFARAVKPVHDEARKRFGDEVFSLLR